MPGMPAGQFGIRPGGIMAATDEFQITIEGEGGHAAMPHNTIDPVIIAAQLILALQTIVSRNVDPMREALLSVTMIEAGTAFNIIPRTVKLTGTVRTLDETVRKFMEERIRKVSTGIARHLRGDRLDPLSQRLSRHRQRRRADGVCGGGCQHDLGRHRC